MKKSVSMTVQVVLDFDDSDYTGVQHAQDVIENIRRLLPEASIKPVEIDIAPNKAYGARAAVA